ncbi:MAG: folylpolyglutamate synthase/dihydrofolate synthase family protein [Candidatus Kapaibacteriales bacterium]
MSDKSEILEKLYSKLRGGIAPGLERTIKLTKFVDNPHLKYKTLHIAGTNGKGTSCSIVSSILVEAGLKVGLYTSPHILNFNERIRINGIAVSDSEIIAAYKVLESKAEEIGATFFEITTVMAFMIFAEKGIDVAVLETGMGGRWDSTNICEPLASGITYIGKDHEEFLGNTLEKIAGEKAGIIKQGVTTYSYESRPEILSVFEKKAKDVGAELSLCHQIEIEKLRQELSFTKWYDISDLFLKNIWLGKSLALDALSTFDKSVNQESELLKKALDNLNKNSGYIGRLNYFEYLGRKVLLDVAHNEDSIKLQIAEVKKYISKNNISKEDVCYIFGMMADKDAENAISAISEVSNKLIAYKLGMPRAMPHESILEIASKYITITNIEVDAVKALQTGVKAISEKGLIVITGSFHMAEMFLPLLR